MNRVEKKFWGKLGFFGLGYQQKNGFADSITTKTSGYIFYKSIHIMNGKIWSGCVQTAPN